MLGNAGKYNAQLRDLDSFANEVLRKRKEKQRLTTMENTMVRDVLGE
jgi:hypothetical protein